METIRYLHSWFVIAAAARPFRYNALSPQKQGWKKWKGCGISDLGGASECVKTGINELTRNRIPL